MTQQPHVFFSNRLEILYEELKNSLYGKNTSPFARRLVIIPSTAMNSWLQLQLAKDPECGIAAGLEIGLIDTSINKLLSLMLTPKPMADVTIHPHNQELAFLIESALLEALNNYSSSIPSQQAAWEPLFKYLNTDRNNEKRLIALSDSLATLFAQYGRYGCGMLAEWEKGIGNCWQADLWRQLKKSHPNLIFPYQLLDQAAEDLAHSSSSILPEQLQIHVFGMSFLPKKTHDFFMHVGSIIPVHYYVLSPCQLFWSDVCSDRESHRLKKFWENKSISEGQLSALEEILSDRNTLLGNFGRMGREMAIQIEESIQNTAELYQLPASIHEHVQYAEHITEEIYFAPSEGTLTLLQAIQSDMALLRTLDTDHKVELSSSDNSIQLHIAPTKQREVEILYNTLVGLLTKSAESDHPLTPNDVIVMVPDYVEYESTIADIFGSKSSVLDYQMGEVNVLAKSTLVQGFLHLLSLASSRWETKEILNLLDFSAFRIKQGLTYDDRQIIEKWTEKSGVFWGQTPKHRNEIMQQEHRERTLVDISETGTWEYSCRRLLLGMAVEANQMEDSDHMDIPALEGIETSQVGLISKWIVLLKSLQEDLKPLIDKTQMSLQDWSRYLICLYEAYFYVDKSNKELLEESLALHSQLEGIAKSGRLLEPKTFAFESIKVRLETALHEMTANFREMHLQAVKFCPLLPMRALPAKVLVLIGMQEETFPKRDNHFSLNELVNHPAADYNPSQSEFDRYLFLEALLSARNTLILSYVGYSQDDQKESAPSLLIQELLNYADEGYTIGNQLPSHHCTKKHPFESFNSSYFISHSALKSYREEDYRLALAHYDPTKSPEHRFISDFSITSQSHVEIESYLNIKDLSNFASNPLKTYFNRSLGIYLHKDESIEEEAFSLSHLEKYQLRQKGIQNAFEPLVKIAQKKGQLPPGMFKTLAVHDLKNDIEKIHLNLSSSGVNPEALFSVVFSNHCKEPYYTDEGVLMLPPVKIKSNHGQEFKLIGHLKEISAAGLLFHQELDFKSLLKIWPQYLTLQCAIKQFNLPIASQAISTKLPKPVHMQIDDAADQLLSFIDYYHIGLKQPSLLLPEWIEVLLEGNPDALQNKMLAAFDDSFVPFYNEYALWLFRSTNVLPNSTLLMENYGPFAKEQFSELLKYSLGKKNAKI